MDANIAQIKLKFINIITISLKSIKNLVILKQENY